MSQPMSNWLLAGLALILMSACASGGPGAFRCSKSQAAKPASASYKPGDIVDTSTGTLLPLESLLDALHEAQVVYVGETHVNMEDHRVQLEILKGLYERNPSLVLAMEMFPREAQPVLNDYSRGRITQSQMVDRSDWSNVWGYPFQLYQDLLTFAGDHHLEILALNTPPDIVRKVSRGGLASLSPQERSQVAEIFLMNDPRHREYVYKEYEQHLKDTIKDFDTFYEAQLAWNETMAETLGRRVATSRKGEQIVVLVGQGHIVQHLGVPRLTYVRAGHVYRTVIPATPDDAAEAVADKDANFIRVTKEGEPFHRGRLGIMFRPDASGQGLEILAVLPDSPAAKAGLKKGDMLYLFDGAPVTHFPELHEALKRGGPTHRLGIKRDGASLTIELSIPR